jgi:hypothetical protein
VRPVFPRLQTEQTQHTMQLLANVLPRAKQLVPSAERGLTLSLFAFVAGLEIVGRQSPSDVYDAIACLAFVSVGMFVLAWHRRYPLPWLLWANRLLGRAAERAERLKYDVGLDFRATPPIPRRLPSIARLAALGLLLWASLAATGWMYFPDGWRDAGLATSYTLYVLVLILVWGALCACVLAGVYLPVYVVDQKLKSARPGAVEPGVDAVALVGYGLVAMLVAWLTPPVYAAGLAAAVALVAALAFLLAKRDQPAILWRQSKGGAIFAVPLGRVLSGGVCLVSLFVFTLLVTAAGGKLLATPSVQDPMFITGFLGSLMAWLVPGVVAVVLYHLADRHRTDPARFIPASIQVSGEPPFRKPVQRLLRGWGWRLAEAKDAVRVQAVAPEFSLATEFDPQWPLPLNIEDLKNPDVKHRLQRRDEIQLRRRFYHALRKLLKRVKAEAPAPGGGFWIAPHWWFIESVQWEEPEKTRGDEPETLRPLGPPFAKVFAPRVRQHLYRMLRSTRIDLIYIEDGIGMKAVDRAMRALFELYDVHGGKKPATDITFSGVPNVKAMVHDYSPGNPFKPATGYPEPQFDEVSRFRVLHLFKDRGGEEEEVLPPFDFSWEPSPLALV